MFRELCFATHPFTKAERQRIMRFLMFIPFRPKTDLCLDLNFLADGSENCLIIFYHTVTATRFSISVFPSSFSLILSSGS